jgi:CheY-like chemotaxis protein
MKVLVVEDDASLREGMDEVLSELAEVRTAGSVDVALAALHQERFELVIADLRIAGTARGGRTILEAARRRLHPVAIVSAAAEEEVRQALEPFEADALLGKPFQLEDMMALVERFLFLRSEVERLSKERPPESGWVEAATGVQLLTLQKGQPERALSWVRLQPGASYSWAHLHGRAGGLLLEGELEVGGERQAPPHYFFLSTGQLPEARSQQGCLVLLRALGG